MNARLIFLTLVFFLAGCCVGRGNLQVPGLKSRIEHIQESTIALMELNDNTQYTTFCSGVWVSKIHILTAKHCVSDDPLGLNRLLGIKDTTVGKVFAFKHFPDREKKFDLINRPYFAFVKAVDGTADLALLESIDSVSHKIAYIYSEGLYPGQNVDIVGHPSSLEYTYFTGILSAVRDDYEGRSVLQITTSVAPGSSGGGAFINGQLIGICSFRLRDNIAAAFFVPRKAIVSFLQGEHIL